VFPARYELNSYISFRKRLVSKRLTDNTVLYTKKQVFVPTHVGITDYTSIRPLSASHMLFKNSLIVGECIVQLLKIICSYSRRFINVVNLK
jgi:hypothetical protein